MSGKLVRFDLAGFMSTYAMTIENACRVFSVSRRTVIRGRVSGLVARPVAQIARSIERASPPWSASFWRGFQPGLSTLPLAWRVDLFGEDWRAARSPVELQADEDRRSAAARLGERIEQIASRRAAERRRARERAAREASGAHRADRQAKGRRTPQSAPEGRARGSGFGLVASGRGLKAEAPRSP